jgi:flagellar hook assembly protein FlgD
LADATLAPNFPNPFYNATTFSFALAYAEAVHLAVFDTQGRQVRVLVDDLRSAARHQIHWDGRDDSGKRLPAGIYRYRLRAAGLQYSRPAHLLR